MIEENSTVLGGKAWSNTIAMLRLFATSRAITARFWANSWSAVRNATLLAPAFCAISRNESRSLSGGSHGALLNHMSWWILLLTWNEKFPISNSPRCLTSGMIGAVGTVA